MLSVDNQWINFHSIFDVIVISFSMHVCVWVSEWVVSKLKRFHWIKKCEWRQKNLKITSDYLRKIDEKIRKRSFSITHASPSWLAWVIRQTKNTCFPIVFFWVLFIRPHDSFEKDFLISQKWPQKLIIVRIPESDTFQYRLKIGTIYAIVHISIDGTRTVTICCICYLYKKLTDSQSNLKHFFLF